MNFNPNGGTNARAADHDQRHRTRPSSSQFDQPFQTQEPAGSPGRRHVERQHLRPRRQPATSSPRRNQQQRRHPGTGADRDDPNDGQLLRGDPGRLGPESRARRVRQRQRATINDLIVSQQYGSAGGTSYPTLGRARRRPRTPSASARRPGGRRRPTWARTRWPTSRSARTGPAIYRLQPRRLADSSGPITVQNPTVTAPDGGNTSFFPPGSHHRHQQPSIPGSAGDLDQPLAEPAQLLRHLVGRAQRGGRGGAHAAEGSVSSLRRRSGRA